MVLALEMDVALLPGSAVPEVQGALACHPGVEVPKSPGAAPADLVSLEAPSIPGEGPASILGVEGPACLASPEDLASLEGHVPAVHLEDEVLSSLEVGDPASSLGEQDPGLLLNVVSFHFFFFFLSIFIYLGCTMQHVGS